MAAAAKNWETQAKTNAVLAAALKALDERLTELEQLRNWKEEVEKALDDLTDESVVLRKRLDTVRPDNTAALDRLRFGGSTKKRSSVQPEDRSLITSTQQEGAADAKATAGGKDGDTGVEKKARAGIKFSDDIVEKHIARAIRARDWTTYLVAFLQILLGGPLLYELYNTTDVYARGLAGLLAFSSILSGLVALNAVKWMVIRPLTLSVVLQPWLLVIGYSYMDTAGKEVQKLNKFCELSFVDVSDCSFRKHTSYARAGYGAASIFLSVLAGFLLLRMRDEVLGLEVQQAVQHRIRSLAKGIPTSTMPRSRGGTSVYASQATSMYGGINISSTAGLPSGLGGQPLALPPPPQSVYSQKSPGLFGAIDGLAKSKGAAPPPAAALTSGVGEELAQASPVEARNAPTAPSGASALPHLPTNNNRSTKLGGGQPTSIAE